MDNPAVFVISALRSLVEVAGLFLLGQGILTLIVGARREKNVIYQLFQLLTRPVIRIARAITPRVVIDRHLPFVTFFLLFWLWIALAYARQSVCLASQLAC
ncbi:MAG: hypothetical protein IPL58_01280 [Betaproteobacteria bacterium]|uniref:YggT family protein n=1 Tax=Candidatus Proximibacter danicus TaxID=2954365 RepID=A0A9D7PQB2_9PROT|nr:hypothetical protein [Candidatus Proximibacter danicus]MBK9445516.1 hypothetical protein [Betaproteobacteria bacterium]